MSTESREIALSLAVSKFGANSPLDALDAAEAFDAFLDPVTESNQKDGANLYDVGAYPFVPLPEEDQPRFSAKELHQAGVSNWNAALDVVKSAIQFEDHWPWRDRLVKLIKDTKR